MTKAHLTLAGLVTLVLASPVAAQPFGGGFSRADANRDGAVSRAEAQGARLKMFNRLDRDSDGQISAQESEAARARIAAMARFADSAVVLSGQQLDTDGDGSLTQAEFMARNPVFEMIDRNGDGVASEDEIATARQALRQR